MNEESILKQRWKLGISGTESEPAPKTHSEPTVSENRVIARTWPAYPRVKSVADREFGMGLSTFAPLWTTDCEALYVNIRYRRRCMKADEPLMRENGGCYSKMLNLYDRQDRF